MRQDRLITVTTKATGRPPSGPPIARPLSWPAPHCRPQAVHPREGWRVRVVDQSDLTDKLQSRWPSAAPHLPAGQINTLPLPTGDPSVGITWQVITGWRGGRRVHHGFVSSCLLCTGGARAGLHYRAIRCVCKDIIIILTCNILLLSKKIMNESY